MSVIQNDWTAESYNHNARFVSTLGAPVLELLSPKPTERILDIGCGDGVLTAKLAESGATVVGIDGSHDMLKAAQSLGLNVHQMDAQSLTFHNEFDAVFSNAALHWMLDPDAVIKGVRLALRPKGRFVAEFGGSGNIAKVQAATAQVLAARNKQLPTIWYYPTVKEYSDKLTAQGFTIDYMELIPRPTPVPTGVKGWMATFGKLLLAEISPKEQVKALDEMEAILEPELKTADGWIVDYVRLRFSAHLAN
jgi:trans-aconitate methyltransferase